MNTELITFDEKQENILKATIAKNTNNAQFALFIQVCKQTGLNPFAKQIYAVVRGNDMTIQTGIDGYRILAERSGKYAGQIGPEWCDETGEWKDYWISNKPPVAARVGVLRRDFEKPIWGMARHASYEQSSSPLWRKMPEVMLAKCAEALALRRAFPAELSGIYTKEEMDQADQSGAPLPTPSIQVVQEQHETEQEQEAEQVQGEVVESEPVTVSLLRARVAEIKPTSNGNLVTFEQFYQLVTRKPYTSDDAISPNDSDKMNRRLDVFAQARANKQHSA